MHCRRPFPDRRPTMARVVDGDGEGQTGPIVADDEHGPRRDVSPRNHAVKVDQRQAFPHRDTKTLVVRVIRIRAAVPIAQEIVRPEGVVIRSAGSGRDGERRDGQHARLEDSLRPDERHAAPVERESCREQLPRQDIAVAVDLALQPFEGGIPNRCVPGAIVHGDLRCRLAARTENPRDNSWPGAPSHPVSRSVPSRRNAGHPPQSTSGKRTDDEEVEACSRAAPRQSRPRIQPSPAITFASSSGPINAGRRKLAGPCSAIQRTEARTWQASLMR